MKQSIQVLIKLAPVFMFVHGLGVTLFVGQVVYGALRRMRMVACDFYGVFSRLLV